MYRSPQRTCSSSRAGKLFADVIMTGRLDAWPLPLMIDGFARGISEREAILEHLIVDRRRFEDST